MSGIVGVVNLDGAPVDRRLLHRLTDFLDFRGPDAKQVWINEADGGNVGFGHTLLVTTDEARHEHQPFTLDGRVWIVADARVDAWSDLIAALRACGQEVSSPARPAPGSTPVDHASIAGNGENRDKRHDRKFLTDVELILRAYHAWGEDCVEHLLGDFAFGIWDGPRQRLFCARDHFGHKPFFYFRVGRTFVFSNTLNCLRLHQEVSGRLNNLAVADFLLFDFNQDPTTTFFADISRLAAAHSLVLRTDTLSIRRYWTLPDLEAVRYQRPQDCLDQFREVMDAAVSDRLRSNTACLALSGGLDSPTVAVSARRVLDRRGTFSDLWAYTVAYNRVVPHQEQYYAGLVGEALHIPIKLCVADEGTLYGDYTQTTYSTPEPWHGPMSFPVNPLPDIAARGRVLLTGLGADPLLSSARLGHVRRLIKQREFSQLARDLIAYFTADGRFSRLYLRGHWEKLFHPNLGQEAYPPWLNPDMEKQFGLRDRWENKRFGRRLISKPNHSVRPEATEAMRDFWWTLNFQASDPGSTRYPVEVREPYFDVRLVRFLLALPVLPWCSDKEILRQSARGILPEPVRLRTKSPMSADPIIAALQRPESAWVDHFEPAPNLSAFVLQDRIPPIFGMQDTVQAWVHLRPLTLNFWLQRLDTLV